MKDTRTTPAELRLFLRRVPLFADLSDQGLEVLARVSHIKTIAKGETIFYQDDVGDAAYVVISGCIGILVVTSDGRELVISEMHTGDCFGELAPLTGQPRTANAIARELSEVVAIPREEFLAMLTAEPKLMWRVLQLVAERLRASSRRESALVFLDAPARLARILLQLDREESARGFITLSQDELAQRVGVARQTAAKTLGQWRRAGWIFTGRGKIVVLNRVALRQVEEAPH